MLCIREPKLHALSWTGIYTLEECAASIFRAEERWRHHIPPKHSHLSTSIHTWHTADFIVLLKEAPVLQEAYYISGCKLKVISYFEKVQLSTSFKQNK
jgi:hypothetical protein